IAANYSRYVVDLNRAPDDAALYEGQLSTGLCPKQTFAGDDIYFDDIDIDIADRVKAYWQPYHDQLRSALDATASAHGKALLWDAHSIPSQVPRLFEGELPVLNIGTNDGASCDASVSDAVAAVAAASDYESVVNGRFKGGYITRHYGEPDAGIHAIQLELSQQAYMNERTLEYDRQGADDVQQTLRAMLEAFLDAA
ncbi:MAG: N-formylglutamate amidohydrolase, partial [Pseudomonadota bacterium]